jgi:hypothetical protein
MRRPAGGDPFSHHVLQLAVHLALSQTLAFEIDNPNDKVVAMQIDRLGTPGTDMKTSF